MADVVKKVDRGIHPNERTQSFTQADAGAGDLLLVQDSLGKPAKNVIINATAALSLRLNTRRTIFPPAPQDGGLQGHWEQTHDNLTQGQVVEDDTGALIELAGGDSLSLSNDVPVRNIKIVSTSGDFDILTM